MSGPLILNVSDPRVAQLAKAISETIDADIGEHGPANGPLVVEALLAQLTAAVMRTEPYDERVMRLVSISTSISKWVNEMAALVAPESDGKPH